MNRGSFRLIRSISPSSLICIIIPSERGNSVLTPLLFHQQVVLFRLHDFDTIFGFRRIHVILESALRGYYVRVSETSSTDLLFQTTTAIIIQYAHLFPSASESTSNPFRTVALTASKALAPLFTCVQSTLSFLEISVRTLVTVDKQLLEGLRSQYLSAKTVSFLPALVKYPYVLSILQLKLLLYSKAVMIITWALVPLHLANVIPLWAIFWLWKSFLCLGYCQRPAWDLIHHRWLRCCISCCSTYSLYTSFRYFGAAIVWDFLFDWPSDQSN